MHRVARMTEPSNQQISVFGALACPPDFSQNGAAELVLSWPSSLHASRCEYMCPWWDEKKPTASGHGFQVNGHSQFRSSPVPVGC